MDLGLKENSCPTPPPPFLIGKNAANGSWTQNLTLHLKLERAQGASWVD